MSPEETVAVLERWRSLLDNIAQVSLDEISDLEALSGLLAERQRFIDELQTLDAPVREAAAARDLGWLDLPEEARTKAERLVASGLVIVEAIGQRDSRIMETIEERRRGTLERLRRSGLCREYHGAASAATACHPVIVDGEV
ncbi:MAG: hypothetical protein PHU25_16425 [Deltaproteobacteria bacterium]|nr:hypothetical protein [Deltaproteobacteria bacterium]